MFEAAFGTVLKLKYLHEFVISKFPCLYSYAAEVHNTVISCK